MCLRARAAVDRLVDRRKVPRERCDVVGMGIVIALAEEDATCSHYKICLRRAGCPALPTKVINRSVKISYDLDVRGVNLGEMGHFGEEKAARSST